MSGAGDSNQQVTGDVPSDPANYEDFLQTRRSIRAARSPGHGTATKGILKYKSSATFTLPIGPMHACCSPDKPTLYIQANPLTMSG